MGYYVLLMEASPHLQLPVFVSPSYPETSPSYPETSPLYPETSPSFPGTGPGPIWGPGPGPELRATFHTSPLFVLRRFYAFPGPLQKDARRKAMQIPGTNASRSLTATQLVTKSVMSLHPHNPQFRSQVKPPIPHTLNRYSRTRCGGLVPANRH